MTSSARRLVPHVLAVLITGCAAEVGSDAIGRDDVAAANEPLLFGSDDRRELYEAPQALQGLANSVAVVLEPRYLSRLPDGYQITTHDRLMLRETVPVCASERFRDQPNPGGCTAFVVGPDTIATAGHCASEQVCAGQRFFVFGFAMQRSADSPRPVPRLRFGANDVYECRSIVDRGYSYLNTGVPGDYADWVVVRVDRPIEGHPPLRLRQTGVVANGTPLVIIGYPFGLPLKIAAGGVVRDNTRALLFGADLDSYPGNSGSPVFNADTLEVEGIFFQGQDDVERVTEDGQPCVRSRVCDGTRGCPEPYNRPFPFQGVGRIAQILPAVGGSRATCASDDPLAANVRAGSMGVTAQGCNGNDAQGRRRVQQCLCVANGASTASWLCDSVPQCRSLSELSAPPSSSSPASPGGCAVADANEGPLLALLVGGALIVATRRRRLR